MVVGNQNNMKKVITYGTYDLLHYGHIRLLERAKALGDYLIVGVTADDFDKNRGKINVQQSLIERIEAIRELEIADEIIIEEYEGQKIDDIKRYDIDIFAIGSDWKGHFDYLKEYCQVIYLDRTEGISSSAIRTNNRRIKLGLLGEDRIIQKFKQESLFVNGVDAIEICPKSNYIEQLEKLDAVYLVTQPNYHYEQIKEALLSGKHVLCESPISLSVEETTNLYKIAQENDCILMEGIKTAYATAYIRMILIVKSGKIGDIVSIDATATSQIDIDKINQNNYDDTWSSINAWGPTVMLPIFQLLGTNYRHKTIVSKMKNTSFDLFTQINFIYDNSVATIKVGKGIKSEGELIISGTKGYVYIPAPWWKTDYFEIRYENLQNNQRYFYQLDGEGIRYELVAFLKAIETKKLSNHISREISLAICQVIEDFHNKKHFIEII